MDAELVALIFFTILALVAGGILFQKWQNSSPIEPNVPIFDDKKEESEEKEKEKKSSIKIFFGSQSGTAETFASELVVEAKTYGFDAEEIDLEDYDPDDLTEETFAVFLMATFGEGEPTDNAQDFYEWLCSEEREDTSLENLTYAVFALGNKQYEHYCFIGRKVDTEFAKMKGNRLLEHGEGDDDGTLEEDYEAWKEKFWDEAKRHFGISSDMAAAIPEFAPTLEFEWLEEKKDEEYNLGHGFLRDPKFQAAFAPVIVNKELRTDTSDGGSTKHIDLDITGAPNLEYVTAANLGIFPRNDYKLAAKMMKRLGVQPKALFQPRRGSYSGARPPKGLSSDFPKPCSIQDAFLWYLDISSNVRIPLLKMLSHYCTDPIEKQKMLNYTTGEGKEKFNADHKDMLEVFNEFPSLSVPIDHFLEFAPRMIPRYYTISSSSKANPNILSITVSLFKSSKTEGREYKGVCSHFLNSLRAGNDKLCCFVRNSTFRFPRKITTPLVMIGPGTGIAPFMGFLQEIRMLRAQKEEETGKNMLFFGCRNKSKDYIYQDVLENDVKNGVLDELVVAFSRDQEEKVYVQHRIHEKKEQLWELMSKHKTMFYVCGGTSMGRQVKEALVAVAKDVGGKTDEQAKQYMKVMTDRGRYISELWS